jgi:hypothetical protein
MFQKILCSCCNEIWGARHYEVNEQIAKLYLKIISVMSALSGSHCTKISISQQYNRHGWHGTAVSTKTKNAAQVHRFEN